MRLKGRVSHRVTAEVRALLQERQGWRKAVLDAGSLPAGRAFRGGGRVAIDTGPNPSPPAGSLPLAE